MGKRDFTVLCPCCQSKLTVDRATGALLAHERPPAGPAKTFEQALSEEKKRRETAQDVFAQAFHEHEHREEILEKKFQEAVKRAEKDDTEPPPRPFEFD
ncbi:MAG: hypothetical protein ACE5JI_06180 [Acidobacteriota bacterium]